MYGNYIVDKITANSTYFVLFAAGALLGLALTALLYFIFVKVKRKKKPASKPYERLNPAEDAPLVEAIGELERISLDISPVDYVQTAAGLLLPMFQNIAKEYTGGVRSVSLVASIDGTEKKRISVDTDFTIENLMFFLQDVADVSENTLLAVTDKYSSIVNTALSLLGLGGSVRTVTAKNVFLFLRKNAEKKSKKLDKLEQKQAKATEKLRIAEEKRERNAKAPYKRKGRRFFAFFHNIFPKRKTAEKEPQGEREKTEAYNKLINKVLAEVFRNMLPGLADSVRKLYGNGYEGGEYD